MKQIEIAKIQPTEQYLCRRTLDHLREAEAHDMITVLHIDGKHYLSDGHNRAFLYHRLGFEKIIADVQDPAQFNPAYGFGYYAEKVEEDAEICKRLGIKSIADLERRVVPTRDDVKRLSASSALEFDEATRDQ